MSRRQSYLEPHVSWLGWACIQPPPVWTQQQFLQSFLFVLAEQRVRSRSFEYMPLLLHVVLGHHMPRSVVSQQCCSWQLWHVLGLPMPAQTQSHLLRLHNLFSDRGPGYQDNLHKVQLKSWLQQRHSIADCKWHLLCSDKRSRKVRWHMHSSSDLLVSTSKQYQFASGESTDSNWVWAIQKDAWRYTWHWSQAEDKGKNVVQPHLIHGS